MGFAPRLCAISLFSCVGCHVTLSIFLAGGLLLVIGAFTLYIDYLVDVRRNMIAYLSIGLIFCVCWSSAWAIAFYSVCVWILLNTRICYLIIVRSRHITRLLSRCMRCIFCSVRVRYFLYLSSASIFFRLFMFGMFASIKALTPSLHFFLLEPYEIDHPISHIPLIVVYMRLRAIVLLYASHSSILFRDYPDFYYLYD